MAKTKRTTKPKMAKKQKKNMKQKKTVTRKVGVQRPRFGPLTSVNTAPVSIGNSIRGSSSFVQQVPGGVRVVGRDFCFPATATGNVQTWTVCGGTPLTPAAFSDSVLRQYVQMYQKFKWNGCMAHYITSSATTATGDVAFYHGKNRNSVFINQTSTQLLPMLMSDADTVLGPQWTNHSVNLTIRPVWKSTDYGMNSDINEYAEGELFLLSKTSTTDSPGYVIFDYDITFSEMQISPRLLALPLPRAQFKNVALGGASVTIGTTTQILLPVYGNDISGSASTAPTGVVSGDVYKVILDITNSSSLPSGITNLAVYNTGGNTQILPTDGTTLYAKYETTSFYFYPNVEAAFSGVGVAGVIIPGAPITTATFTLQTWMSLVGTVASTNVNPNF